MKRGVGMTEFEDQGFVYAMINPSLEGLVKVGKTQKSPKERAEELSKATGVPTPFVVVYEIAVNNCSKAEKFVHTMLEEKGVRLTNNREFFCTSVTEVINTMLSYKDIDDNNENNINTEIISSESPNNESTEITVTLSEFGKAISNRNDENRKKPWSAALEMAKAYQFGQGEMLQDAEEAYTWYRKAAALGSGEAYLELGQMHRLGSGCVKSENLALRFFKEGVKAGNVCCYAMMEDLYFHKFEDENALKCWIKFLDQVTSSEPYVGKHCYEYISRRIICKQAHYSEGLEYTDEIINRMAPFKVQILEWGMNKKEWLETLTDLMDKKALLQRNDMLMTYVLENL